MDEKRDLASRKFDAMLGVALDPDLPKLATRVMVLIATRYMNADHGGEAWPSIATLRRDLNIASDAAVRKALAALVANSHLVAEHRAGATTVYRLPSDQNPASKSTGVESATPIQNEADTPVSFEADTPPIFEADTPIQNEATNTGERIPENEHRRMNTGKESPPTPSVKKNPSKARKPKAPSSSAAEIALGSFDEFYQAYPRREGRRAAERAYKAALKRGADPAAILRAAARYSVERTREPDAAKRHQFTKLPATWLNGDHWLDAPAPITEPGAPGAPRQGQRGIQREGHGFRVMRVGEFT
ncbi:hypothetical protein AMST5_03597 [freshwater sediment metagenome]|uniref:Helix-turn-helix domain-containing protein n=1 Tax=freshwater sediment metagenome TaxID=556182 RepID=A0AA48M5R3_9ZZZZ